MNNIETISSKDALGNKIGCVTLTKHFFKKNGIAENRSKDLPFFLSEYKSLPVQYMNQVHGTSVQTINKYFDEVLKNICKPVLIIHQMSPGGFDSSMTTEGANPDQIGRFCDNDNVFGYIASHLVRFEMMTRKFVPKSKQFWVPNAMLMPTMSLEGANGGCFMLGNIAPKICRNIINLGLNGNYNEAKKINDTLIDLDWNILSRGAAGIKYALDLLGFVGGDPRKPLNILSETDKKNIKDSLNVSGITEVE